MTASGAARGTPEAFEAFGLAPALGEAVGAAGYREPTPIQREAIPQVMAGRDLLGCAQTGTGKTAAFALPLLHRLLAQRLAPGRRRIRVLVLAPTRELAAQIGASFGNYGRKTGIRHHVVYGGIGKGPQIQALRRGVDVLVATPGRLLDLMGDGEVDFRDVATFVLDEADRMLDMGFIHDVQRIAKALPRARQTLLFSATLPRGIRSLASHLLDDPVHVAVDPVRSTEEPIAQAVYFVETPRKVDLLLGLLGNGEIDRALVFTRTKHGANRLAQKLARARIEATAIHGNKSQAARERALRDFKLGTTRVVVATDIAARGIDVKDLSHVINFDLPHEPETYVHRVGRTGRAGARGVALSLCSSQERSYLASIEQLTRRRLERAEVPEPLRSSDERGRGERSVHDPRPASPRPGARPRSSRPRGRRRRGRGSRPAGPRSRMEPTG